MDLRQPVSRGMASPGLLAGLCSALALAACTAVPDSRAPTAEHKPATRPLAVTSRTPGPARSPNRVLPPAPAPLAPAASGTTAAQQGIRPGPPVTSLGIEEAEARSALAAFRLTCPSLIRRSDRSGLTRGADWQPACTAATGWTGPSAGFFARYFEAAVIGDGRAFATGYYEPEIAGARERRAGYEVPIYGRPDDLVEVDLGLFADDLKGRRIRGQVTGGKLVRYPERAQIVAGAINSHAPVIAWGADPIEVFFLQVQGSGLLRLPDGGIMRVGYDTQNGRDYTGIGKLMKDRGIFQPGDSTSMQGIVAKLKSMPDGGASIMNENKSFVFFRELGGEGPLGALGLPVTGRTSVAADPSFVPLGAPVFLAMDRFEASGLWVAQDTGGAIKGANRFDTYWGSGAEARRVAGGMSGRGAAWLLLPIGTIARLGPVQPAAAPSLPFTLPADLDAGTPPQR